MNHYVPGTELWTLNTFLNNSSQQLFQAETITHILQMRRLRFRKVSFVTVLS